MKFLTTDDAFAALKKDGSVVAWGNNLYGADTSSVDSDLSSDVVEVYANRGVFAALKSDGSVIVWGTGSGSDASSVSSDLTSGVVKIFTSEYAFAALKSDGSVVTWGGMDDGTGNAGDSSS